MKSKVSKKKNGKKKVARKSEQKIFKIDWLALNQPFTQSDRLEAFGMMWAETAQIIPKSYEKKKAQLATIAVETGNKLQSLKNENLSNTFVLGKCGEDFVCGLHYRKASTMSLIPKLEVLMFYCQDDYSEGGLGDILMENLTRVLGISLFGGDTIEFNIKARSEKHGFVEFLTRRHGFKLDLGAPKDSKPGWYTKVIEY